MYAVTVIMFELYFVVLFFFMYFYSLIFQMPDMSGKEPELVTNATSAWGLDFHHKKDLIYWSDTETRKVSHTYPIKSSLCLYHRQNGV